MFQTVDEIYNHIGQAMFDALPDDWEEAWFEISIEKLDRSTESKQRFLNQGSASSFNVDKINGVFQDSQCDEAFFQLFKIMRKNENDIPWNKARFWMNLEGDFEIDFKFDEDYAWYISIDSESKEFDELDIDVIKQIKSWEGLPEDAPRFWR